MPHNTEKIKHAYKSKYNLERENQVILLKITHGKKWHFLAVKKLKKRKNVCENHDFCYVEMPKEDNKILK